jgi:hypothetical protein
VSSSAAAGKLTGAITEGPHPRSGSRQRRSCGSSTSAMTTIHPRLARVLERASLGACPRVPRTVSAFSDAQRLGFRSDHTGT